MERRAQIYNLKQSFIREFGRKSQPAENKFISPGPLVPKAVKERRLAAERILMERRASPLPPRYKPDGDEVTRLDSGGFTVDSIVVVYPRTKDNRPFAALLTDVTLGRTNTGEQAVNFMAMAKMGTKVRLISLGGGTTVKRV